jgi:hypothetical protein
MTKAHLQALANELARNGVVDAEQLRLAGAVASTVQSMIGSGWTAPVDGVYVIDGRELDAVVRAQVADHVGGPQSVISGAAAARFSGMRWIPEYLGDVLVLIPTHRRRRSRGFVLVQRTQALHEIGCWRHQGLTIAGPARAAVDTGRQISRITMMSEAQQLRDVRGVVLGAVLDGRCTPEELLSVLGTGSIRHSRLVRRACLDAARGALSPPEAEMVEDALQFGVPFYANVEVWIHGKFLGIVDGWLVGTGVGWESDSESEHGETGRLDATISRGESFRLAGAHLAHVSPARYRKEGRQWWLREPFAEVRRRQSQGLGDPPGLELRKPQGPLLHEAQETSPPYRLPDLSRCVLAERRADEAA